MVLAAAEFVEEIMGFRLESGGTLANDGPKLGGPWEVESMPAITTDSGLQMTETPNSVEAPKMAKV